jgi:hypothetical protein
MKIIESTIDCLTLVTLLQIENRPHTNYYGQSWLERWSVAIPPMGEGAYRHCRDIEPMLRRLITSQRPNVRGSGSTAPLPADTAPAASPGVAAP